MTIESYTYIFRGTVLPERANVNISTPLTAEMTDLNGKKIGEMTTSIVASQITVHVTLTQKFDEIFILKNDGKNAIFTLKNDIEDAVRVLVDVLGYTNSCGYDVEIAQVKDSSGKVHVFGVNTHDVKKFPLKRPKTFSEIMPLLSAEQGDCLRLCLSDLREAIRSPKDKGFFCYRSIECLRQYFVNVNNLDNNKFEDRKKSWDILEHELDVGHDKVKTLEGSAKFARHGDKKPYSAAEGEEMLETTRGIIDKYIVYACNGYKKSK